MIRLPALAALTLLAACAQQQQPARTPAEAAQLQACREQADSTIERRDRAVLYRDEAFPQGLGRDDPQRQTERLARSFDRDRMVQQCVRGAAGGGS